MQIKKDDRNRIIFGYLLIAPAFVLMLVFFVWPFALGFLTSLRGGRGFGGAFVGLQNYRLTLADPRFWNSLRVSIVFTVFFIVASGGLGLILAMALVARPKGHQFYLSVSFIPYISTPVIGALVWLNLLGEPFGLINVALTRMGLETIPWLKQPVWALTSLIFIQVWYTVGYNTLLFTAGLQAIPDSYFEYAELEGCGFFQRLYYVTLPLIIPTTVFVVTASTMYGFINSFVLAELLTGGGPFEATNVIMSYIFELGFDSLRLGQANAVTLITFVLFMAVAFVQFTYQRRQFSGLQ
ncbi:MAG: sugar ABC transporter permease [Spirochaetales bacterium]|nr:sugar ABC transporter permease [Spirochaetales bacterium]